MVTRHSGLLAVLLAAALLPGCKTAVEPSPSPGLVRVTFKGAEADTNIILQNDTSRFSRWDTFFMVASQGRLVNGDYYSAVYCNPTADRVSTAMFNALAREWLDGTPISLQDYQDITPQNSRYRKYVIFESYVPPGSYSRLTFALTASEMEIFIPKHYVNPVALPPGISPSLDFPGTYTVAENGVTEIEIEIQPYKSLRRYQDQFYFERKLTVVSVKQH
jgi:hypothetical protein